MQSFSIKTLGCKVNQCDSQELREKLVVSGMHEVSGNESADLNIINTCCVTIGADRKSRCAIRRAVGCKGDGLVVVVGCYPGYDRHVIERIAEVEAVFDNSQKPDFWDWVKKRVSSEESSVGYRTGLRRVFSGRTRAFLKIQDGCDNRCSYCIIPHVRGISKSRPIEEIVKEAEQRSGEGFKEIVLTGVCLGSFGKDFDRKVDLIDVIEKIEAITGIERIRLSSIEATDVTDTLIEKMGQSSKLCPHLHIPFQSGDDEVLDAMNKKLRTVDFKKIVTKARKMIKNLAITCDFIVGFPLEKEKNFRNTAKFLEFVKPARVHFFPYSKRRGAVEYPQLVADKVVKDRMILLRELSQDLAEAYREHFIAKVLEVLFEKKVEGGWQGYSQNYIKVLVNEHKCLANSLEQVRVEHLEKDFVRGTLI